MKIQTIFSGALVTAVLFASSATLAAPHHEVLKANTYKLEQRIDSGVKIGKLTPSETRQLRTELGKLKATVKAANKDHKITNWERKNAASKELALSKNITKLTNNRDVVKKHGNDKHKLTPAKQMQQGKHF